MKTVAVVGGGASGIAAAITAARHGRDVTVFEAEDRIGKKILASGNGKCNLANRHVSAACYNDPRAAAMVMRTGEDRIEAFFEGCGVPLRADGAGRVYPYAEQSSCVLNALRAESARLGVRILTGTPVSKLKKEESGWRLNEKSFDAVIWATGSPATFGRDSLSALRCLGLPVKPFAPSLAPVLTDKPMLSGLKGVRVKALVSLEQRGKTLAETEGEVLFKDNGLSGIAVFDLSAEVARRGGGGYGIVLDLYPTLSEEKLSEYIKTGGEGVCHKAILQNAHRIAGIYDNAGIARVLKHYAFRLESVGHMTLAQAAVGGVVLDELSDTLESKTYPGLYVTGEAADADGSCGGYNLMWAWTSGLIAGDAV